MLLCMYLCCYICIYVCVYRFARIVFMEVMASLLPTRCNIIHMTIQISVISIMTRTWCFLFNFPDANVFIVISCRGNHWNFGKLGVKKISRVSLVFSEGKNKKKPLYLKNIPVGWWLLLPYNNHLALKWVSSYQLLYFSNT